MADEKIKSKLTKVNPWMIISVILVIVVIAVVIFFRGGSTGMAVASNNLNSEEAANTALKFINENLVQPNTTATLVNVTKFKGIYNVTVSYQERDVSVFLTEDGTNMFLSSPLDITKNLPTQEEQQQAQPTETPKTDKPSVQLYVMAFCPYGIQAESAMKPVIDLLGSKADIKVHFIANVGGTTPDSVQSLHGAVEAQEDLRQVCIMKYYNQKTYWNYVTTINSNCASKYNDATSYNTCWKDAASKAGIDASKIDTCSKASEGVELLKADDTLATTNGVSGSPTLIINGVKYNGARTSDAYKEGICNAFTTAPAECSQNLSTTAAAASGNCG